MLTNTKQAKDMLANPLLQIYPGRAMTCVLDADKALCQLSGAEGGTRRTPDQDDCRPNCQNIAYTDRDINHLKARAQLLHETVTDPLAPSIRHQRERHELDRISRIIRRHDQGNRPPDMRMATQTWAATESDPQRAAILQAADRLLAGTPLRSTGNLSVVQLAAEAEVKYWIIAQKHTDLRDHFQRLATQTTNTPAAPQEAISAEDRMREEITELKRQRATLETW